jgi:hypothetical protein
MKKTSHLAVISVLMFGVSGTVFSENSESPYPSDAEAPISLPSVDRYTDQQARMVESESSEAWGMGKRAVPTAHNPFPFGGGYQDD